MINASEITTAIEAQLRDALDNNYTIERSEYVNMDPDRTPWVCVYTGELTYDPATLGRDLNSWKAIFEPRIVIQSSSGHSGKQAEERLESYIKEVLDVIMANKTFGNTVAMISGLNISYSYNETESESLYFQMAEITLTTEVRTQ